MRLWASLESVSFDALCLHLGNRVEVALRLWDAYIGPAESLGSGNSFPLDLSGLDRRSVVQVLSAGPTITAVTGRLCRPATGQLAWRIESAVDIAVFARNPVLQSTLSGMAGEEGVAPCWAFGSLSVSSPETATGNDRLVPAKLLGLKSLCLQAKDARFGQWLDVRRYGDLASDPDVIGTPVCIAELDLSD